MLTEQKIKNEILPAIFKDCGYQFNVIAVRKADKNTNTFAFELNHTNKKIWFKIEIIWGEISTIFALINNKYKGIGVFHGNDNGGREFYPSFHFWQTMFNAIV